MRSVTAIILAAGRGERFRSAVPKPLAALHSAPLILYSLDQFARHPAVRELIVTANPQNSKKIEQCVRLREYPKPVRVVQGGRRRQDSVRRALRHLPAECARVVIHDAARPFVDERMISDVIAALSAYPAAITAVPVKATIKKVESRKKKVRIVSETLRREELVEVQTPQGFHRDVLEAAYRRFGRATVTDDASLVEKTGIRVAVVEGSFRNIKITTPEDLAIAEALLCRGTACRAPTAARSR